MKKKIILISGDPNSINSEIIYKSWNKIPKNYKRDIFVISNYNLLKEQYQKLKYKINLVKVNNLDNSINSNKLKIIDIDVNYKNPFKVSKKSSSNFVIQSLNLAHKLALRKDVGGIINCPINKSLLGKKGIGVTEFLASKCLIKDNFEVMVIKNQNLMISPITTHLDLKNVPKKISKKIIVQKLVIIHKWFKKLYGKKPKFAILGLNPHNAEFRKNSEETKIIIPAVRKLKKIGILLSGPFAADTLFIKNYKKYDIIVGMYHDQILTPFKTLFKFDAINITLGLKYNRVSPDHGIAADKILKKNSDPTSLLKCVDFIFKLKK